MLGIGLVSGIFTRVWMDFLIGLVEREWELGLGMVLIVETTNALLYLANPTLKALRYMMRLLSDMR